MTTFHDDFYPKQVSNTLILFSYGKLIIKQVRMLFEEHLKKIDDSNEYLLLN